MVICFAYKELILTAAFWHSLGVAGTPGFSAKIDNGNMCQMTTTVVKINRSPQCCAGVNEEKKYSP
jgi:hypothetical protein